MAAPALLSAMLAFPAPARAFDLPEAMKDAGRRLERVLGLHDTPAVNAIKPKITFPDGTSSLVPGSFYLVHLDCSILVSKSELETNGLVVNQSTFIAHSLWFSDSASDGSIPTNPVKLVNAFSITRDSASGTVTSFQNDTCSDTFILQGNNGVFTVSFLFADTKTSSKAIKAFSSAGKFLAGIVPLFLGGPLGATVTGAAKEAGDAADPIKGIIEAFNDNAHKAIVSVPLKTAPDPKQPIVVHTAYSDVKITIVPVNDIATQIMKYPKLADSFKKVFGAVTSTYATGMTKETAIDHCASFAYALSHNYKFSDKDKAYMLGFFATLGFSSDVDVRLSCIGDRDVALNILNQKFDYNENPFGPYQGISQTDIDNHNWERPRTKMNSFAAHGYLETLVNILPTFAQTGTAASKASVLAWIGSSQIQVDDPTTALFPADTSSADGFVNSLTATYKRYGCFIQDAKVNPGTYDAIMLAIPMAPASADTFKRDELVGVYLYLEGTGKKKPAARVLKAVFTKDTNAIGEAAKRFNGQCYNAKIDITGLGP